MRLLSYADNSEGIGRRIPKQRGKGLPLLFADLGSGQSLCWRRVRRYRIRTIDHIWLRQTILVLSICFSAIVYAADFNGHVIGVIDGDSLRVMHNGRAEQVRLTGVDCPEKGQAYGKRAKQATAALAFDRDVTVLPVSKDRYARTLATIVLPDGKNLNHELVREGWCWWYRKYAPTDTELEQLEREARDQKIGLWTDPSPTPPWVYRKALRE